MATRGLRKWAAKTTGIHGFFSGKQNSRETPEGGIDGGSSEGSSTSETRARGQSVKDAAAMWERGGAAQTESKGGLQRRPSAEALRARSSSVQNATSKWEARSTTGNLNSEPGKLEDMSMYKSRQTRSMTVSGQAPGSKQRGEGRWVCEIPFPCAVRK